MPALFDPLRHLRVDLRVEVFIGQDGRVYLRYDNKHTNENKNEARAVAGKYGKLIRLQLENGGASVHKLLAHGKITLDEMRRMEGPFVT